MDPVIKYEIFINKNQHNQAIKNKNILNSTVRGKLF